MNDENKFIEIDFVWPHWRYKVTKKYYKKIQKATDTEKIEIAKHLVLNNIFLLKRNFNIAFRNHIYSEIEKNTDIFFKIKKIFLKILAKVAMKESDINSAESVGLIGVESIMSSELNLIKFEKLSHLHDSTTKYFEQKWESALRRGKSDDALIYHILVKESKTGIYNVYDLYESTFPYTGGLKPQKYNYIANSFIIENLQNYKFYEDISTPTILFEFGINELSELLSNNFIENIHNIIFEILGIEKTIENILRYNKLIKDLISIASYEFFIHLNLDEKIDLLNIELNLRDLINQIVKREFDLDIFQLRIILSSLKQSGFIDLAIKLVKIYLERKSASIDEKELYYYYDSLGTFYREIEDHENALIYYKKANDVIDLATPWYYFDYPFNFKEVLKINPDDLKQSLEYRRAISLKNLGESYGHVEDYEKMEKLFNEILNIAENIEYNEEKYSIFWNLSFAYKRLNLFNEERKFLNNAINIHSIINANHEEYVESRIKEFLFTGMNEEKLIEIQNQEQFNNYYKNGLLNNKSFNFKESITFFNHALSIAETMDNEENIFKCLKGLSFSFLYLKDYEQSKIYFERILEKNKDFETIATLTIIYYYNDQKEKTIELINSIFNVYQENEPKYHNLLKSWNRNIINHFNHSVLEELILEVINRYSLDKAQILLDLGIINADMGFFELAINLFEKIQTFTSNKQDIAQALCNIGSVYSNMDNHREAIRFYYKALKFDPSNPVIYKDLAASKGYTFNYLGAIRDINKAIQKAQESNSYQRYIVAYENEKKQYEFFLRNIININGIKLQNAIDTFITAERLLTDYKDKTTLIDASPIVKSYAKGLEMILDNHISEKLRDYLSKQFPNGKISNNQVNYKFGHLLWKEKRTTTLGRWKRILNDFQKKTSNQELENIRNFLEKLLKPGGFKHIHKACEFLTPLRDPTSHYKNIAINEIFPIRHKAIFLINNVIDVLK